MAQKEFYRQIAGVMRSAIKPTADTPLIVLTILSFFNILIAISASAEIKLTENTTTSILPHSEYLLSIMHCDKAVTISNPGSNIHFHHS